MPELSTRLELKVLSGRYEPGEISGYFPEFFKLKDQCKFNNLPQNQSVLQRSEKR
jgi:hypothetical protein